MLVLARAVFAGFLLLISLGCSGARDLDLDPDIARKSLDKALKAWVDGKKPTDLQPEIIVGDYVWESGKKLLSYEIKSNEMNDGNNLHLFVVCQFANPKGKKPIKTDVTYIVGTDPVITIFPQ